MAMERKEWLRIRAINIPWYRALVNSGRVTADGMRQGWGVRMDGSAVSPKRISGRSARFKALRAERKQRWKELGHAK